MVSKYEQIKIDLKDQMDTGKLKPGHKLPKDKEMCEIYDTSTITVIKALNELCTEGLLTRKRGVGTFVKEKAIDPVKKGKVLRIGILWRIQLKPKNMLHEYFGQINQGILESFNLSLEDTHWEDYGKKDCMVANWESKEFSVFLEAISEPITDLTKTPPFEVIKKKNYDGIITLGITDNDYLDKLLTLGVPVIIADYLNAQFDFRADQIYTDPTPAYQSAINYFLENKAKAIHFTGGFITPSAPRRDMDWQDYLDATDNKRIVDPDSYIRLGAFRQILEQNQIKVSDKWIHFVHDADCSNEKLAENLLNLPEEDIPDAIICHTYSQASTIMKYFAENGRHILAAGTTDSKKGGPALPIIASGKEMGMIAVDILISKIQKPKRLPFRAGVPMKFEELQKFKP